MMTLRNRIAPSRAVPSEDVTVKKLYAIAFATLADCVESAVAGRLVRDPGLWA